MATLTSITYRIPTVTAIGGRDGSVRSADGLIDLQVALPKEMGGPGGKTNPEELFAAGYAACFHSAVKRVAADKKVAIGKSTVEAHVVLGPNDDGTGFILAAELQVSLPGADAESAKEVVHGAHLISSYSSLPSASVSKWLHPYRMNPSSSLWHPIGHERSGPTASRAVRTVCGGALRGAYPRLPSCKRLPRTEKTLRCPGR